MSGENLPTQTTPPRAGVGLPEWLRLKRKLKIVLAVLLVAGLAFGLFAWHEGSVLIAPSNCKIGPPPANLPVESVQFPSSSGATAHGWLVSGKPGKGVIILMHGIRANRLQMMGLAPFLFHAGYSVLLFDFQAHGESLGKHITAGYLESRDAAAAVDFIHQKLPGEKVGVIGFSMGGAAALLAKPPLPVNAMILESVYPTIQQAVTDRLETRFGWFGKLGAPFLTWQLKPRLGFDADDLRPIKQAGQIGVPKLFIAGTADRDTTLQETKDLFNAAAEPKQLWLVEGAAHVDLHAFARDEYERRVLDFLAKTLN
jgi:alpha-beta hydrolase superfamily lysophospholipase